MRAFSSEPAAALVDLLRTQGVNFRGPFYTPGKHVVFVVERYIFLESEIIDLSRQNRLDPQGIQEFAQGLTADSK